MNFSREPKTGWIIQAGGLAVLAGIVLALYLYVVSAAGSGWISPSYNLHYDLLAEGFLHGQVSLIKQPPADLLALTNPYDPQARQGMDILWDASIYHGKYYLYWGPVPALVGLPLKILFNQPLRSELLTLLALILAFLFQILILWLLWRRYFHNLPCWTLLAGCLALGASNPVFWLLQRPSVYETAITAGQGFLLGGLFFLLLGISQKKASPVLLFAAGTCLALAAGSRLSLALAVVWCALITALWLAQRGGGLRKAVRRWFWFGAPLVMAALLMLVYNTARFDSPLEFGLRYQLTGIDMRGNAVFSTEYLPPNLRFYLLGAPALREKFPFFFARMGDENLRKTDSLPDSYYYHEPVTGVLVTAPFTLFGFTGLLEALFSVRAAFTSFTRRRKLLSLDWIMLLLGGTFVCALLPVMAYFYASMRFEWDFFPVFGLLAVTGFWLTYQKWREKPVWAASLAGAFAVSTLLSAGIGLLISFSEYHACFGKVNAAAYQSLADGFNQIYSVINQTWLRACRVFRLKTRKICLWKNRIC